MSDFCLKQGQGMRGGAAPPHPKDISSTPPGVYIQQKYRKFISERNKWFYA